MSALNKSVLVLNKIWLPIRVIPAYRALVLIFANKASAVDPNYFTYNWEEWLKQLILKTDSVIVSSHQDIKVPEIIVLSMYDKIFKKNVKLTKRNLYIRDGYKCQYTGERMKESEADIDHIIPRSMGGRNSWNNMVVCSKEVNRRKADRTPEQAGLKLIKKPTKPHPDKMLIDPKINIPESWSKFIKGNV